MALDMVKTAAALGVLLIVALTGMFVMCVYIVKHIHTLVEYCNWWSQCIVCDYTINFDN